MPQALSRRRCRWGAAGVLWVVLGAGGALAQSAPDELGLRFTPEIARGIAKRIAKDVFASRYELGPARTDEATERIARRLMAFAHEHQDQAQEFVEFFGGELFAYHDHPDKEHRDPGMPRTLGIGLGKRLLPIMPSVRTLVAGMREDVQPMLPPREQVRLMGDIMAVGAAMDAFESHMERWSKGDVDSHGDPFMSGERNLATDANGESQALQQARQQAQTAVDNSWRAYWEQYVSHAKDLYALDDAQAATADSILAEAISRTEQFDADPAWRQRVYRSHVWSHLWRELELGYYHPANTHLTDVFSEQRAAFNEIGEELRVRVDAIPTDAQREAAERRIRAAMAEKGFDVLLDETR